MRDSTGRFLKGTHWRPRKPHWDRDWLYEQYVVLGRSTGRFDRDNVITLCRPCHSWVHSLANGGREFLA